MRVYVIRHGHAIPARAPLADADRWLHAEGRALLTDTAALLRTEGVTFDAVLTSPLVRAVQTAELLAVGVGFAGAVEALPALAPGGGVQHAADELPARGIAVAAVGHEPSISALAAHLTGRRFGGLRPGQIVCVEDGVARWSLDPNRLAIDRF